MITHFFTLPEEAALRGCMNFSGIVYTCVGALNGLAVFDTPGGAGVGEDGGLVVFSSNIRYRLLLIDIAILQLIDGIDHFEQPAFPIGVVKVSDFLSVFVRITI